MPESGPRVLVVDDEAQMVGIVAFDLIVLDVMLPGASGVQLCQRIRTASDIPVILLTAKGQEADRLTGLLAGADDYVTKPFSPRKLALRASAIVRRTRSGRGEHDELTNGPLRIDPAQRVATLDGQVLRLSDVELRLLTALTRHVGDVVGWRELLNEVWYTGETGGGRDMIKTTVYRLRQHLGDRAASTGIGWVVQHYGWSVTYGLLTLFVALAIGLLALIGPEEKRLMAHHRSMSATDKA